MALRSIAGVLLVALLVGLVGWPRRSLACGPFFPRAITVYKVHPDFPLSQFAEGQIGIIQPTYARLYLFVAYRYLTGEPLDEGQRKAVESLWNARLGIEPDTSADASAGSVDSDKTARAWQDARAKVPGVGPAPALESFDRSIKTSDSYNSYANCLEDSFRTAAATLSARIQKLGADNPEIKDWVQAQDAVYSNCSTGEATPALAKSGSPAIVQADRAYQMASAYFYSDRFDEAGKVFRDIAADTGSPWHGLAPYLVARALVRKATLSAGPGKSDLTILGQAESQLIRVLGDSSLQSIHPAANRLLSFVRFRLHPDERIRELADSVMKKTFDATFRQDICDYTLLMDSYAKEDLDSVAAAARKDDVTDWIFAVQAKGRTALDYCLKKWTESHSTAWLVASLTKVDPSDPRAGELIAAARKVKEGSPGFADANFHAVRLMIPKGNKQETLAFLDSVIARSATGVPRSAINELFSERMYLATSLDDFLKYAIRTPSGISMDYDGQELQEDSSQNADLKPLAGNVVLDTDSVGIINQRLPLTVLREVASSAALPESIKLEAALATWVRAVILGNEPVARQMADILKTADPDLGTSIAPYLSAASADEKTFAAIFLMLKDPGARPYVRAGVGRQTAVDKLDEYRDNWWCAYNPKTWGDGSNFAVTGGEPDESGKKAAGPQIKSPDFLGAAEKAAAAAEWKKLSAIPPGPNYLGGQVAEWAQKKPDDPRLAEALYLVVRSTRYGCTDKETVKYSKAAFDLLHKRFPDSSWAKMTKYWYGT
jgi:hypothetical protein